MPCPQSFNKLVAYLSLLNQNIEYSNGKFRLIDSTGYDAWRIPALRHHEQLPKRTFTRSSTHL